MVSKNNLQFIFTSLKNDLRVKNYEISDSSIQINFWMIDEAVSFYKQYYEIFEMNFIDNYNFEFTTENFYQDIPVENDKFSREKILEVSPFKIKRQLEDRVEYYKRLRSYFRKNHIKKMEILLSENKSEFIYANCKELAVGSNSNVIIQEYIKKMTDEELCTLIKEIGHDYSAISATKYGAYVVQALISLAISKKSQEFLSYYFELHIVSHEIGNYSIPKIIMMY